MTGPAAFAELCPGCFTDKGAAGICPHCGYDETLKRGPLFLPHRALLHHGQYLIGKVLGKPGGFGITYLALDTRLETKVAIKEYLPRDLAGRDAGHATISAHSDEDGEVFRFGLTQFLQEARTLARFDHANIVRVRNFFEENDTGYLVMDYYDGITLADYLAQQPQGRLPEKTAVGILMPILDGLREVHAKNFLHRDIKPQNIYLTTANRPILLDFGAARQAMSARSRSLSVVLSEGYAPYEQYHRRGEQGPWTDIYACAAVLYHAVAGEAPPPATERVHKDDLDIAGLGVSAALAEALRSGLATDHVKRPQQMAGFQALLVESRVPVLTELVPPKFERTALTAPANMVTPQPIERSQSKGRSSLAVWWVTVVAALVFIAIVVIDSREGKKKEPTADTTVPAIVKAGVESAKAPTVVATAAPVSAAQGATRPDEVPTPPPALPLPKASEDADIAAWKFVEKSSKKEDYESYLQRYPNGQFNALAKSRIEKLKTDSIARETAARDQSAWDAAERANTEEAYRRYQGEYPTGKYVGQVAARLKQIEADAALRAVVAEAEHWQRADAATDSAIVQGYLDRYPAGLHVAQAQLKLAAIKKKQEDELRAEAEQWQRAEAATDSATVQNFLDRYPAGRYVTVARLKLIAIKKKEDEVRPGRVFKDCDACPEMVVIPAGRFRMGNPPGEVGRQRDEGPPHTVTISHPFAAGKFEVTFDEWDACRREGGCERNPSDLGWGRGRRPVMNIYLAEAREYVKWLSRKSRQTYRLLSESEWEYVARAGTHTAFSTGTNINPTQANYDARDSYQGSALGAYPGRSLPVGQYPPNAFGLHDVHGNVSEWVEDCWNADYIGAPSDGSARTTGECDWNITRGGKFSDHPRRLRSAFRGNVFESGILGRSHFTGFRVARTLR